MFSFLNQHWYKKKSLWLLPLLPLAWLYQLGMVCRQRLYEKGVFTATKLAVPVIVVGNISVGGTGKTPFVIALAKALQSQGYQPGIVSRGYGAAAPHYPLLVSHQAHPGEVGDEPLLIAQQTSCPVVVDPVRVRAGEYLLANTSCDIIISDDGLQHLALARDIEIALIGPLGHGNGYCLPAGPLRESIRRLETVDFIATRQADSPAKGAYQWQVKLGIPYRLEDAAKTIDWQALSGTVHLVTGIAQPQSFFAAVESKLAATSCTIVRHVFPDHHAFQTKDLAFSESELVLMTEKDAVKCRELGLKNGAVVPLEVDINTLLINKIIGKIHAIPAH